MRRDERNTISDILRRKKIYNFVSRGKRLRLRMINWSICARVRLDDRPVSFLSSIIPNETIIRFVRTRFIPVGRPRPETQPAFHVYPKSVVRIPFSTRVLYKHIYVDVDDVLEFSERSRTIAMYERMRKSEFQTHDVRVKNCPVWNKNPKIFPTRVAVKNFRIRLRKYQIFFNVLICIYIYT